MVLPCSASHSPSVFPALSSCWSEACITISLCLLPNPSFHHGHYFLTIPAFTQKYDQPDKSMSVAQTDLSKDRKSTRLNSSHVRISYAVFCLKKKTSDQSPCHITHE